MSELKPCPFCGSADIKDLGMIKGCGVSCTNEGCAAYMANIPLDKWNTRVSERENQQLREALKVCAGALNQKFGELSLHEHLLTQFPATQGHIPLRDFCIKQDKALSHPAVVALKEEE